jgi:hypothetical protein
LGLEAFFLPKMKVCLFNRLFLNSRQQQHVIFRIFCC